MSKLVTVPLFEADELSKRAFSKAYITWVESDPAAHVRDENFAAIESFLKYFGFDLEDWSYDRGYIHVQIDNANLHHINPAQAIADYDQWSIGLFLSEYIRDEYAQRIMDGQPMKDIIREVAFSAGSMAESEISAYESEEAFIEDCGANNWYFFRNGVMYDEDAVI